MASDKFRVRFRFLLEKKLNIKSPSIEIILGGKNVTISSEDAETPISDSQWLVINAKNVSTQAEADEFAIKLKAACEAASVMVRLGINSGVNLATAALGKSFKNHILQESGLLIRDNVHGVDVFVDNGNVRMFGIKATASVLAEPNVFFQEINNHFDVAASLSRRGKDIVLLLNYALTRKDPVSQIVFAVSAVEMLGQEESWSDEQVSLIKHVADKVRLESFGSAEERLEVSDAILKGLYKLSLRQGVLRLLTRLRLDYLKSSWDEMYGKRSTLVHGLAPRPGMDYSSFAHQAVSLCGRILLAAISEELRDADRHVDKFYGIMQKDSAPTAD